jgi:hypothetical protein
LERAEQIEAEVKARSGGVLKDGDFVEVPISALLTLIPEIPFDHDYANMWDPEMLVKLLQRTAARYSHSGFLFFRTMKRTKPILATGALSGAELNSARNRGAPVLCVFRDDGKKLAKQESHGRMYWYPTIVLPSDMTTQLFNTTA